MFFFCVSASVNCLCNNRRLSVLQADLLALPRSGQQQHQGSGIRLLFPPHTGHARRQPLLRLLGSRTGSSFSGGAPNKSAPSPAALLGLKVIKTAGFNHNFDTNSLFQCCYLKFPLGLLWSQKLVLDSTAFRSQVQHSLKPHGSVVPVALCLKMKSLI